MYGFLWLGLRKKYMPVDDCVFNLGIPLGVLSSIVMLHMMFFMIYEWEIAKSW
jgi:hypothetical protein